MIHGAGVRNPSPRTVTYSRPLSAKPPRPLKNSRACWGSGTSRRLAGARRLADGRRDGLRALRSSDLFGQGAAPAEQHGSRDRLKQRALLRRDQVGAQQENAAAHVARCPERAAIGCHAPVPPGNPANPERRKEDFSLMMTRSADNCFMRQYSCARNNWRTISRSSASSMRTRRWANRRKFRGPTARNVQRAAARAHRKTAAAKRRSTARRWPASGTNELRRDRCPSDGVAPAPGPGQRQRALKGCGVRDICPRGPAPARGSGRRWWRKQCAPWFPEECAPCAAGSSPGRARSRRCSKAAGRR